MSRELRITPETATVLRELTSKPGVERYGRELGEATGLKPATVGNILSRLEAAGLAKSELEDPFVAEQEKRPRRRYYTPLIDREESILDKIIGQRGEPKTDREKIPNPPAEDSHDTSTGSEKSKWISPRLREKELGLPKVAEHPKGADKPGNSIRIGEELSDSGKPWQIIDKKK